MLPLLVNGDINTIFSGKADLFNKFFADQCTPLNNLNKLPPLHLKTDKKLCNQVLIKMTYLLSITLIPTILMDGTICQLEW